MSETTTTTAPESGASTQQSATILGGGQQTAPNPQQQQATTPTAPTAPAGPADWLTDGNFSSGFSGRLPDDLKPYAGSLKKFEGVPLTDVLKSYGELEKTVGKRVAPPAPDAKPEEIAAWRRITGAPEKPEDYGIKRPDDMPEAMWNSDLATGFAALAHKHHLSPAAAADMVNWWNGFQKDAMGKLHAQAELDVQNEMQTAVASLEKTWGGREAAQANMQAADRAFNQLAKVAGVDPNGEDVFGILNNPIVVRLMHAHAQLVSEDKQMTGGTAGSNLTMQQQAQDILTNPANPLHADYHGKNGTERQTKAAQRVEALMKASQ